MHIVVLENHPSSRRGGKELSLMSVCQALAQQGHRITFLYLASGDLLKQYQTFSDLVLRIRHPRLHVKTLLKSASGFWQDLRQVLRALADTQPDLVYLDQDRGCVFAVVLAKLLKVPVVFHLRQPAFATLPIQEKWALRSINQFLAVSHQAKQDWSGLGLDPQKIQVVYNGVDIDRYTIATDRSAAKQFFGMPADAPVICYLGRIDPEKGLESLIQAMARVIQQYPNLHLLIVGQPVCHATPWAGQQYQASLHQLATQLNLQDQVHFLGHIATPETAYQASHITVLPTLVSEPFGRTVIESMACGVPVVGSRTGGIPEILTGEFAAGLFQPNNPDDLAQKLLTILDWQANHPDLAQHCRQHIADRFTQSATFQAIEAILVQTIQHP